MAITITANCDRSVSYSEPVAVTITFTNSSTEVTITDLHVTPDPIHSGVRIGQVDFGLPLTVPATSTAKKTFHVVGTTGNRRGAVPSSFRVAIDATVSDGSKASCNSPYIAVQWPNSTIAGSAWFHVPAFAGIHPAVFG